MKKLLFVITLFSISSCVDKSKSIENEKLQSELNKCATSETTEVNTKEFAENYIKALNSADWKSELSKYLRPGDERDNFFKEHDAFRTSFQNYKATIKHLAVEGNKALLWINIRANYAESFALDKSAYGDEIYKGIEAKNQSLSWDEIWSFDVVNNKFGEEWEFLKDNYAILKVLTVEK